MGQLKILHTLAPSTLCLNRIYFERIIAYCALAVVGPDRLMFSIDYPFSPNSRGKAFLDSLPVSTDDREKNAHGNAERLLKL